MSTPKPKVTKAQLRQQLRSLSAHLVHTHHFAAMSLDKTSRERMKGSSVILSITDGAGKNIVEPVAIRNGLSPDTIAALQKDIQHSYEYTIEFKP